jgi:hypothetical protein
MPYHFEFDPAHRILLVVLEGDVGDREMLKINDDIKAHVTDLNLSAGTSDFSTVTTFRVACHTMRMAALQPSPYDEQTPRFVVAQRDHLFGLARMYQLIGSRTRAKLQVVRSGEEVFSALGIQNPKFEKLPWSTVATSRDKRRVPLTNRPEKSPTGMSGLKVVDVTMRNGMEELVGSIPTGSTKSHNRGYPLAHFELRVQQKTTC